MDGWVGGWSCGLGLDSSVMAAGVDCCRPLRSRVGTEHRALCGSSRQCQCKSDELATALFCGGPLALPLGTPNQQHNREWECRTAGGMFKYKQVEMGTQSTCFEGAKLRITYGNRLPVLLLMYYYY